MRPGNRAQARRVTDEAQREKDQRRLQDCAAGRDLHSGDTPRIQHHQSLAVSTAQKPGGLGQRGDHVVDDLAARLVDDGPCPGAIPGTQKPPPGGRTSETASLTGEELTLRSASTVGAATLAMANILRIPRVCCVVA